MKFFKTGLKINFYFKFFYYTDYSFYKYSKFRKNIFLKCMNKKKINAKNNSSIRDKNISLINKYYNVSVYNGKKEFFFKNFNYFISLFMFIFLKKNNLFSDKINYMFIYNTLYSKKINFDFNYLINDIIYSQNSIFDIKMVKTSKKNKSKIKKKFIFELSYVYRNKRLKQTLKLINNNVLQNNNLNIKNNFFSTFCEILLDPKNCFLWKRKIGIYNKAMKKFYKKNLI